MSSIDVLKLKLILVAAIAAFSGCASVQAPSGYLPDASETQWDVYGGWITVVYWNKNKAITANGEFIAFQDSVAYVLTESQPVSIRYTDVRSVSLDIRAKSSGALAAWALVGTLSTASHGWYLIFSFPLWLITGIPAAVSESYDDRYAMDRPSISWWQSVSKFSRFPQGIPKQVDLNMLKLKEFSL